MDSPDNGPDPEEDYLLEEVLCVHCLEVIPFEANLCGHCKAPQNFIGSSNPFERIHAEGFILRTAAAGTRSWLVVLGIWMIYLPGLLVIAMLVWLTARDGSFYPDPVLGAAAGMALLGFFVVLRTTLNFVRLRTEPLSEDEPADPAGSPD